jgi:IS5 family transposase
MKSTAPNQVSFAQAE